MTVIFSTFQDAGHVAYLLPLVQKLVQDGQKVEFWSGRPVGEWLPAGAEFRQLVRKRSGAVPFVMACSHGPTLRKSLEAFLQKAEESTLDLPEDYDFSWTSLLPADELEFKKRLLERDVDLVVDDPCHVLSWVGAFCQGHGVPNIRFAPSVFFTLLGRLHLTELWDKALAAFQRLGAPQEAAEVPEAELAPVRGSAPQHCFFTIVPELLRTLGVEVDADGTFENHDGKQCQVLGPLHDVSRQGALDEELLAWCNECSFVLVSFGSMISQAAGSSACLQEELRKLLDALAGRRVLVNVVLPSCPERQGLRMTGWLPQAAVLVHRNLECFVSHCGQGGVSEAILAGVPIVAYPFFHDQLLLAEAVEKLGCGVRLQRFDHGPGKPLAEAESALAQAVAMKGRVEELGAQVRAMDGLGVAYAKMQEMIAWSKQNPCS